MDAHAIERRIDRLEEQEFVWGELGFPELARVLANQRHDLEFTLGTLPAVVTPRAGFGVYKGDLP